MVRGHEVCGVPYRLLLSKGSGIPRCHAMIHAEGMSQEEGNLEERGDKVGAGERHRNQDPFF